jgi:PAS domain S-box-containing protein
MPKPLAVLHLEDSPDDSELVARALRIGGLECTIRTVHDRAGLGAALAEGGFDLVLSDFSLPDVDGAFALARVREVWPDTPFIFVSGTIGDDRAVEMLHCGATDYVLKDRPERLAPAVHRALREAEESARRRQAEQALRDSERSLEDSESRYRLLFDRNPLPMWVYDVDSLAFLEVNEMACRNYGYARDEFLRMTLKDIRPPEDVGALMEDIRAIKSAMSAGRASPSWSRGAAWRHRRKDGTVFEVEIVSMPVPFAGRDARLVLAQDVSGERRLEEQLRHAHKMDAIGRLAGGVAHDFNNLLFLISGYGEQLLRLAEGEPARAKVLGILKATETAASLTRQLLAFSRKEPPRPRVVDLDGVVLDMEKMLRRLIGEDIALEVVPAPALWPVVADPAEMEQVLMNLAVNARDAMPAGGRLSIETQNVDVDTAYARAHVGLTPGPYVLLSVSDTGCGMDPRTLEHIFEPFFTTKEKDKGTGLGLSIVYAIVKRGRGSILVYSHPGQGTTFKIFLPKTGGTRADDPRARADAAPARGTETVLVVEDEKEVRFLARDALKDHGYHVLETSDGAEALGLVQRPDVDLLLTDVVLETMSGRELTEKARGLRPGLRVLCMSGYTHEVLTRRDALPKDVAFLQKPFTLKTLLLKVREVLDR